MIPRFKSWSGRDFHLGNNYIVLIITFIIVFLKLNNAVSYYSTPSLGKIDGSQRMMALSVDKTTSKPYLGIARKITRSQGNVDVPGFVDESKLVLVESKDALTWRETGDLQIKGIQKIIDKISGKAKYFIGLEDPDIWVDDLRKKHVYFTIAFKLKERLGYKVYLGHAQGNSLDNLIATTPVLGPIGKGVDGFKEASISPIVTGKGRLNLNEFLLWDPYEGISAISVSLARDMSKPWKYLRTAFDPRKTNYSWIAGHASPCAILPKDFASKKDLLVCIVNGREKTKTINGQRVSLGF